MKFNQPTQKTHIGIINILIVLAILFAVVPAVFAEGSGPLTAIPGLGKVPNATLIRMHNTEGNWVREQESLFQTANELSKSWLKLIAAEKKSGKDVTILQAAFDIFDNELTASREIHIQAGVVVFNLIGWKASGEVRDRQAAGQSILDGRTYLNDAKFRLINAMADLRKSFNKWRASRVGPHTFYDVSNP